MNDDRDHAGRPPRGFATRQVHAGQEPDPLTGSRAVPIHATSSFVFRSSDHAQAVFAGDVRGNRYARMDNPTVQVLADRIADLEGRPEGSGVVLSSGQAATTSVMLGLAHPGGTWIVGNALFGGTASVTSKLLVPFGVEVRFVEPTAEGVGAAMDDTVVGVWVETIANPSGLVPDLPVLAEVTRSARVPLVVDNTWGCGGYLCQPLRHGADVVVHSTTKWIGGHGVAIGGAVVDGGSFDFEGVEDRYPAFARPNAHGKTLLDDAPGAPVAARVVDLGLSTMGMTASPHAAHAFLLGLETLSLRVQRSCDTAAWLAAELSSLPGVAGVVYPGLEGHPSHDVARRVLRNGFGAVLGVRFESEAVARGTLDALSIVSHLANIGDAKTVAIHPATTTHASLSPEAQHAAGVTPDLIRLSVGLEDPADVWDDLVQASSAALVASDVTLPRGRRA